MVKSEDRSATARHVCISERGDKGYRLGDEARVREGAEEKVVVM